MGISVNGGTSCIGRKLNVHKTLGRPPECFLKVIRTFNLRRLVKGNLSFLILLKLQLNCCFFRTTMFISRLSVQFYN